MRANKRRLHRIEGILREEEGLTAEDVELILSVLPTEYSDAVRRELLKMADQERANGNIIQPARCYGKVKERSGLRGATLDSVLKMMPPESGEKLLAKLALR